MFQAQLSFPGGRPRGFYQPLARFGCLFYFLQAVANTGNNPFFDERQSVHQLQQYVARREAAVGILPCLLPCFAYAMLRHPTADLRASAPRHALPRFRMCRHFLFPHGTHGDCQLTVEVRRHLTGHQHTIPFPAQVGRQECQILRHPDDVCRRHVKASAVGNCQLAVGIKDVKVVLLHSYMIYQSVNMLFQFCLRSVPVSPSILLSCTFLLAPIQTKVEPELNLS